MFSAGQMQIQKPMQQNPQQFNTMVSTQQAQMAPQSHQLVWQGEYWHKSILCDFKIELFPTLQPNVESRKWFQYATDITVDSMFYIVKLYVSIQYFYLQQLVLVFRLYGADFASFSKFIDYGELTLLRLAS